MANPSGKTAVAGPSKNGDNRFVIPLPPSNAARPSQARPTLVPRNVLAPSNQAILKQEPGDDGLPLSAAELTELASAVDSGMRTLLQQNSVSVPSTTDLAVTLESLLALAARLDGVFVQAQDELHSSQQINQETGGRLADEAQKLGKKASDAAKDEELDKVNKELILARAENLGERLARSALQADVANQQHTNALLGEANRCKLETEQKRSRGVLVPIEDFVNEALERAQEIFGSEVLTSWS
ncbi:unnamed protein product [Peniophora sp. CBMAI 1063]|nr:unnamed protein product [Peniophora sp. CBMAI 1063]